MSINDNVPWPIHWWQDPLIPSTVPPPTYNPPQYPWDYQPPVNQPINIPYTVPPIPVISSPPGQYTLILTTELDGLRQENKNLRERIDSLVDSLVKISQGLLTLKKGKVVVNPKPET